MPEIRALVGGYLPSFITSSSDEVTDIPVFVFHTVQPHRFEPQLVHLVRNNYRCLDCDEVASRVKLGKLDQREVALTFDDATWCFWAYAFPLLRKYELRATLFVIPGITSDDRRSYPNLDDLWAGRASSSELIARAAVQPLCTWRELQIMNESGLIDIQSHSLTHALVPVKPRIADFLHPRFKTFFCNIAIPLSTGEDPLRPKRPLRLGAPVFISASRLAGRPRFFEDPGLVAALERHIRANGQREFFQRSGWRAELRRILRRWPLEKRGRFEDREAMVRIDPFASE
jgi:Polysaccharide deacetylase